MTGMANTTTRIIKWACGNAVVAARIFAVNGRPEAEAEEAAGTVEAGTVEGGSVKTMGTPMTRVPVVSLKRLILGTGRRVRFRGTLHLFASSGSRSDYRTGVPHVRIAWHYSSWRDRCAWAGYHCLYAWDGDIYSYPWDERPSALAYARRHRHRY